MPSRVRLVAIDIDGTLLPSSGTKISERNRHALQRAQAAGLHIVIATGRRHQYAEPVLEQIGLSPCSVMISSNGSVVRSFNGDLIRRTLLPVESARALCIALRPFGQTMVFTFDRVQRASLVVENVRSLHQRITAWVQANQDDIEEIAPLERAFDDGEEPIQGMLCGDLPSVHAAQQMLAGDPVSRHITMHRTEYEERDLAILDLLPPGCSKAHALADYAGSLGIAAHEIMAIGDNFNDQSMLEYAGHAVLMGNAGNAMQNIARQNGWTVTHTNDQDGVASIIEPLIEALIEPLTGDAIKDLPQPEKAVATRS